MDMETCCLSPLSKEELEITHHKSLIMVPQITTEE